MSKVADPNPSPPPPRPVRRASITALLWTAKLLGAGILGYASVEKMTGNPGDVRLFEEIGMEPAGRYLIGGLEGLAALAMLIPQSAVYGALLGLGVMCGAIIGHLTVLGLPGLQYAALVAVCCATVLYLRRHDAPFIRNLWDH